MILVAVFNPTKEVKMIPARRVSTVAVTAAIGIGSISVPAMATTSSHWSKTQCQAWTNAFHKRNSHPSTKRTTEGNKVLKGKGCTQRV